LLLKGLPTSADRARPERSRAMALLRLIHAADLPDPASLLRALLGG
jgi:DNA polymerase-3 subunit gamma/tau